MSGLRDALLALSTNAPVRRFVGNFPPARLVSRRFVAGETLDDAIGVIRGLNAQQLRVTLDVLGESVTSAAAAHAARDEYLRALDALAANRVRAHVSVKLTQLGLDVNPELCLDNLRQIIGRAQAGGTFTRIDMEDSTHTQATLNCFKTLRAEFDNVGLVIQSYLYRSEADMQALHALSTNVRLCKGAYKEPPELAFPAKRDVDANYIRLAQAYLEPNGNGNGAFLALATHDEKIINWAKGYLAGQRSRGDRCEFQMLYGIRPRLQRQLAAEGYPVRVYVPYGTHWYPYFMRRLAERPANIWFFISNFFKK